MTPYKTQTINYKTEAEWLELRKNDLTSSEAAALYDKGKYIKTRFELYHLKSTGKTVEFEETQLTKWGVRMEPVIAQGVAEDLGFTIKPLKNYQRIPSVRMGASFDYEITSGKYNGWLFEVKDVNWMVYRDEWEEHEAPEHIEFQVIQQMEVAQRPGSLIVVMDGWKQAHIIYRKRDLEVGARHRRVVQKFWEDIDSGNAPPVNYKTDADFIIGMHQQAKSESKNANDDIEFQEKVKAFEMLNTRVLADGKDLKSKKAELLDMIGDEHSKVYFDGYNISCGMSKEGKGTIITKDMVGQVIGGRKSSRRFQITKLIVKGE